MIYNFQSPQQNFVYIDSSQEEDSQNMAIKYLQEFNHSDLSYQDSSSSDQDQFQNDRFQKSLNQHNNNKNKSHRLCNIKSDKFLLNDNYIKVLQKIIRENQQKLSKKTPLLVAGAETQIIENLQKRKKNYGFFLRTLQIDKNYNKILENKVQKLKKQNERKKKVLQNKKVKQIVRQDEDQMKKFVLDKKLKQQIVIDKITKHAYRLGIQRIRDQQKKIKTKVKQIDQTNFLKTINLQTKQRNQIYQLREQLQKMKQINKINKVDHKKVIKDMQKNVVHTKKSLINKAQTAQLKKFII